MKKISRYITGRGRALIQRVLQVTAPSVKFPLDANPTADMVRPGRISMAELARLGEEKITVFFAPEAGVGPHFMAHCVIAKTLQELGHRVVIVRCFDVYPRCIVMDSMELPQELSEEERRSVCTSCHGPGRE